MSPTHTFPSWASLLVIRPESKTLGASQGLVRLPAQVWECHSASGQESDGWGRFSNLAKKAPENKKMSRRKGSTMASGYNYNTRGQLALHNIAWWQVPMKQAADWRVSGLETLETWPAILVWANHSGCCNMPSKLDLKSCLITSQAKEPWCLHPSGQGVKLFSQGGGAMGKLSNQ